jgi:hypothetical protein
VSSASATATNDGRGNNDAAAEGQKRPIAAKATIATVYFHR